MSLQIIRMIAVYEMRTLLRSWFFRIFTGMTIFGLGIFNVALNVEASGAPWIYKALSSSIPYANLIILNLGQAIVAVFLGSEFLKQDRKNDTVEVIYARSMTNGQYIIGKTLGILAVFLVLNIIVLLIGIGFSFLSNVTAQNVLAYFTYPMLISLPTLVFILGLSFFIMVMVKNQAVTFILLTGYIALTVFYLDKKAWHLFDFIAYKVPMMYSSISGFGNLFEILLHRSIYLILGLGFMALTIYKLSRLPQSNYFRHLPLFIGIGLLLLSSLMIWKYIDNKRSLHTYRNLIVDLNNRYARHQRPVVDSCHIDLEHLNNKISVVAKLSMHNGGPASLDTLIFSLNPELIIKEITIEDQPVAVHSNLHIIRIVLPNPLNQGEHLTLKMRYAGEINENLAFLDQAGKVFQENPVFEVFRLYKRYAFLQNDYVCLTSETLWYPVSGAGYATEIPMKYTPDFVNYTLHVKTRRGLTALSQGKVIPSGEGSFEFKPEFPLTRICLIIGNYEKNFVNVDSIEYSIYTIKGHNYFKSYFPDLQDTLPALIRELKKEYEARLGLNYPFKRLILAEVPIHFSLDIHNYSYTSDAIQPEMILCPEKGVLFSSSDFRGRKYRIEKNMKNNNEEVLPVVVQTDLFNQFFRENFMARRGQHFNYEEIINWHTYSIFPQYLAYFTRLNSEQWPVLGIAMETYISERNNKAGTTLRWFEELSAEEKINLELQNASLEDILKQGIEPVEYHRDRRPISLSDLVQVKGLNLFNMLSSRYDPAELDTLLNRLIRDHAHRAIPFDELNSRFGNHFEMDLLKEVDIWYKQKKLPGFLIRNLNSYRVMDREVSKFQVRFQISNPEDADGIITLNVEFNDPNRQSDDFQGDFQVDFSRKIYIPAKSALDVGYVFNTEPARMSLVTHISRNLPNNLTYDFSGFTETRNVPILDDVIPIRFFDKTNADNEIIADNEDPGFLFQQTSNQAYLKSKIKKDKNDRYKYTTIWSWNPPKEWRPVLRSEFYGNYVHSAYYTRGGTGERTASWTAPLPVEGSYDVYYYVGKLNIGWRRNNRSTNYNLTVYHDQGADKIDHATEEVDAGWNYLGTWYISSDSGRVELSNKSKGDLVFADAVKWVLNK